MLDPPLHIQGFQSALRGQMTIAQQFTAGINGREDVVRETDG